MRIIIGISLFFVLSGAVFAGFTDVPHNHPNSVAIAFLESEGVVFGYPEGVFKPSLGVGRGEFLKMVLLGFKVDVLAVESGFLDIGEGDWFKNYVGTAYSRGWISGFGNGEFRPYEGINTVEALKMLGEVAEWGIVEGAPWYAGYMDYAEKNDILWGNFGVHDRLTRGELSELIYRAFAVKNGISFETMVREWNVDQNVGFFAQAPFGEWSDERQGEGCEEASVLMAVAWAEGRSLNLEAAKSEILAISAYEKSELGTYHDTSLLDTYEVVMRKYLGYSGGSYVEDVTVYDILDELYKGNLVIVPVNGGRLSTPRYNALQHMFLIKGYDSATREFIVNDPGTRWGADVRYGLEEMSLALGDYLTGDLGWMPEGERRMIVVRPSTFLAMN